MELFYYPKNLYIGISILIVFVIIYIQLLLRKEKITRTIFDEKIISMIIPKYIENLKKIKDILLIVALFFMIISASGPQWGIEYKEKPIYNSNIAFVVDTSLSMSAKDIKPSRLESVKLAIKSILDDLTGYRVALIAFQDKAYIQSPITDDYDALSYFVDILTPDMLPYPGTNIADAIYTAYEYLSGYNGDKNVILFTDGEDHSGKVDEMIKLASLGKIKFITVGIGTPTGDLIYDEEKKEYKKDKKGKTVLTKLDEDLLIKIAHQTGGKYIKYTTPEFVASEIKKSLDKIKLSKEGKKIQSYKSRYQYFLIISLLLIFIEFIIMEIKQYE